MRLPPDKDAFVKLIRDNKRIIYKVCNSYCSGRGDREDLAQEIVYHLWKAYSTFNPDMKFSTWMYRISLNVAISFYRRETRRRPFVMLSENLIEFESDYGAPAEEDPKVKMLMMFISELREIDRSIMILYLDDKSYSEIAEIVGITGSNVATRINRIKEKLKTRFLNAKINFYGTG